jgi:hypothetical protein
MIRSPWTDEMSTARIAAFLGAVRDAQQIWDAAQHPVIERWLAGALDRARLAAFGARYEHAVIARAAAARVAVELVPEHARPGCAWAAEARVHQIELWRAFRAALPPVPDGDPDARAVRCARAWAGAGRRGPGKQLAVLYALETMPATAARRQLAALAREYGVRDEAALAYFRVRSVPDHRYAQALCEALDPVISSGCSSAALLAAVEVALCAHWRLLSAAAEAPSAAPPPDRPAMPRRARRLWRAAP